jgi:hypothetical protein
MPCRSDQTDPTNTTILNGIDAPFGVNGPSASAISDTVAEAGAFELRNERLERPWQTVP